MNNQQINIKKIIASLQYRNLPFIWSLFICLGKNECGATKKEETILFHQYGDIIVRKYYSEKIVSQHFCKFYHSNGGDEG